MADSKKTTEQTQQSQTSPWAPTQGLLTSLIGKYSGVDPSVTGDQSSALSNLTSSVSGIPNFGSAGAGAIGKLFNSDNSGQVGMLNTAYDTLRGNLGAETDAMLDALPAIAPVAILRLDNGRAAVVAR